MGSGLRTAGRVAALATLALLLSACLKLDMDLEVSSDDTVSGTMIFAVQKELLELTGGSVEDILGTNSPVPPDIQGVTTEEYEDERFVGQRFTFDAVTLEEFNTSGEADALTITREGDVFAVSGVLDLSTGLTGATGPTGFDAEQFLQGAELRIRITFPGEVTNTNGEVDGNAVTWVPKVGERLELQATASAIGGGGGGSSLTLLLIIGAVVVVAAVVIGIVVAQRRRPVMATAGPGDMGEPGPPPPPGETPALPPAAPPAAPPPGGPPPGGTPPGSQQP
jgi:hypothetical protein